MTAARRSVAAVAACHPPTHELYIIFIHHVEGAHERAVNCMPAARVFCTFSSVGCLVQRTG